MATTDLHFVAGALTPVKRGMRFLGGAVDDGVQVDAAAAAIVAANHDIGTFTAWKFASRLTFLETVPLAADNVTILGDGGVGYAYSILGA